MKGGKFDYLRKYRLLKEDSPLLSQTVTLVGWLVIQTVS